MQNHAWVLRLLKMQMQRRKTWQTEASLVRGSLKLLHTALQPDVDRFGPNAIAARVAHQNEEIGTMLYFGRI
jgi:hypothetical protein